jgi:parvulin-like peptidyl-prolyl isomerase
MADKKARVARRAPINWNPINWKLWLPCLFGAALLGVVCLAARQFWRPGLASAQSPRQQRVAQNTSAPNAAQTTGPIALLAIVNGQQITREYLAHECLMRYGEDVLETAINRQLIMEECNRRGISVSQQEVEADIAHKAKLFGLTSDSYLALLQNERNIDPKQYGRDIIWPALAMRKLAAGQIHVTDEEIRRAFETEIGPQVKVRLIALKDRAKAEWIREKAAAEPETFGVLAKEHSVDETSASASGWIPPIRLHVGDPEVQRVAFSLQKGEISPVLELHKRFLVLKCEGQTEGVAREALPPAQREMYEHKIREHLSDQKMRAVAAGLFESLQNQSQVKNVLNDQQLRQQMPDVAALINGRQILLSELAEDCIARHGIEVLDGEVNRALLTQELKRRELSVAQADLDAEVTRAAESYGMSVPDWLKSVEEQDGVTIGVYIRDAVWPSVALKKLVSGRVQISDDDMQKAFAANFGERVEAMAIVLSNMRQAQQVWEMARNNPTDTFFGELAHQYSIEAVSRANYGRVPPIAQHAGQPLLEQNAFKLQAGELSDIIAVDEKFIILRCLGRTTPEVQKLEEVRDDLRADILEKKMRLEMAKEFDRLKETAQIDNFLAGTSQSGKPKLPPGAQQAPGGRIGTRVPFGPGSVPQQR